MSSRGAVTKNGHVTTDEYQSKDGKMVHDAKVLTGTTSSSMVFPTMLTAQIVNT